MGPTFGVITWDRNIGENPTWKKKKMSPVRSDLNFLRYIYHNIHDVVAPSDFIFGLKFDLFLRGEKDWTK